MAEAHEHAGTGHDARQVAASEHEVRAAEKVDLLTQRHAPPPGFGRPTTIRPGPADPPAEAPPASPLAHVPARDDVDRPHDTRRAGIGPAESRVDAGGGVCGVRRCRGRRVVAGRSRVVRWFLPVASPGRAGTCPASPPPRKARCWRAPRTSEQCAGCRQAHDRRRPFGGRGTDGGRERMRGRIGRQVTVAEDNGDQAGGHGGDPAPADPVLHVITSTQRRGAETFAVDLAAALGARGVASEVAALAPGAGDTLDVATLGPAGLAPATLRALRRRAAGAPAVVAHGSRTLPACALALAGRRTPVVYRSIGDPAGVGRRAGAPPAHAGAARSHDARSPPCGRRPPTPSTISTGSPALGCTSSPTGSPPTAARCRTRRRGRRPAPASACRPACRSWPRSARCRPRSGWPTPSTRWRRWRAPTCWSRATGPRGRRSRSGRPRPSGSGRTSPGCCPARPTRWPRPTWSCRAAAPRACRGC